MASAVEDEKHTLVIEQLLKFSLYCLISRSVRLAGNPGRFLRAIK
jgi:hypothetical protein